MKNFIIRTITAIFFVVALVGGIVTNPLTLLCLFTLITTLSTWEFATIVNKNLNLQVNRFITSAASFFLFLAVWMFNQNLTGSEIFIPYLITIIYMLVAELYLDRENNLLNWAFTFMSQMYVALPLALFNTICFINTPDRVIYFYWYGLSVFFFLWSSDTGAYLFGSWLGKHRLFPRISPKKSWEGSVGGGIVSIAVSQILATYIPFAGNLADTTSRLLWAGLALVVVVFGTWGDLVESLIKRKIGIKDSGNILPGHGGMLDRFDSSLLAIPAAVIYIYTIMLNIIH